MLDRPRNVFVVLLAFAVLGPAAARGDDAPVPDVTEPPAYEEFIVVPLRIHILTSKDLSEVDCHLTDDDIARVLGKVNGIWHKAGVHWGLESIRREEAAWQTRFKLAHELDGGGNLGLWRMLAPEDSRSFDGLHVYYIHQFAVNGVWLGGGVAFVQETAKLRSVEGGIDEPLPRVTAHELGHALNLPHRQARTNLLASGTTGTLLNADEVKTARTKATSLDGAKTVAALRTAAEEMETKDDRPKALLYRRWLAEVPGEGRKEARSQLERLERKAERSSQPAQ